MTKITKKEMVLVSPELFNEVVSGLKTFGGVATELTVIKLNVCRRLDLRLLTKLNRRSGKNEGQGVNA